MPGWNNEEEFILVNLYERFPVLWNSEDFYYHNLVKKHQAWREIAMTLDKSVEEVQKKIGSMKNILRWDKAKIKKLIQTEGAQEQDIDYASNWLAFEKVGFAAYGCEQRKHVDLQEVDTESEDRIIDGDDFDFQHKNNGKTPNNLTLVDRIENGALISTTPMRNTLSGISSMSSNTNHAKTYPTEEPPTVLCSKMYNNIPDVSMRDECDDFGSYVAGKLRGFDLRTRAQLEHKITSVLLRGELGRCKTVAPLDSSAPSSASSSPPRSLIYTPPLSSTPIECTGSRSSQSFEYGTVIFNEASVPRSPPEFPQLSDFIQVTKSCSMNAPTYPARSTFNDDCNSFEDSSPSILVIDSD